MKTIVLVRHATAVSKDAGMDDFDRSLRKKGRKEARAMARWYLSVGKLPDLLVSSPADRALETARLFAKEFGYAKKKIIRNKTLYGGLDASELLSILKTFDDKCQTVMVFGHDPLFSEFAQYIAKGFEDNIPKCGIFGVTANRRSWGAIRRGDGHLEIFEHPAGLRQRRDLAKALREEMSNRIEKGIVNVLAEFKITGLDEDAARSIQRASAKLAKTFAARATLDTTAPGAKRAATSKGRKHKSK